jgi:hypothetical protein
LRKIWAANHTELNLRVDDKSKANRVLLAAEEPFRSVDGIETPEAFRGGQMRADRTEKTRG